MSGGSRSGSGGTALLLHSGEAAGCRWLPVGAAVLADAESNYGGRLLTTAGLSGTRPTVSRVPAASASRRKVAKEGSRRRVDHDRRVTLPPSRRATAKLILTMFTVILAGCDDGHRSDPLLGRWEHDHPVSLFVLQFHRSEYYRELGGYSDKVTLKDEGGTYEAIGDYHFDQKSSPTKASPSSEPKGSAYAARHKIESARCWGASGGASTTREVDRAAAAPPSWPPGATNARFNV